MATIEVSSTIYIAKESFTTVLDGEQITVIAGKTTTEVGSKLMKGREEMFEPLRIHYPVRGRRRPDIEQATAGPGEKRG